MNAPSSLLTLLGASWEFGAPVVAVAWAVEGGLVGFALGDGHLAAADATRTAASSPMHRSNELFM